jgi:hypothetical protein
MAVQISSEQRQRLARPYPWLAGVLFALDEHLRRNHAVFEYTSNPACIFRLSVARAERRLALRDGTRVVAGQRIAQLHFWNEQIPTLPPRGATIAWGRQMRRMIATSLRELAAYLRSRSDLADVAVICGDVPSGTARQRDQIARIMSRFGFETIAEPEHLSLSGRLHRLGENILISLIVLVRNATALRRDTLWRVRVPIYLSRQRLEETFGSASARATPAQEAA